jgi:WD40 repeat protein
MSTFRSLLPAAVVLFAVVPFVSAEPLKERHTLKGHAGKVNAVAFTADGGTLATGSDDKAVKIWDVATGKELRSLAGFAGPIRSLAFSADGKTLAIASAGETVTLWDMTANKERDRFNGTGSPVALAPDGKRIIFLRHGRDEKTIWAEARVLDTATKKERGVWKYAVPANTPDWVEYGALGLSADGKTLALGGSFAGAGVLTLIDLDSGKELANSRDGTNRLGAGGCLTFSPDGKTLTGAGDRAITVWELPAAKERASIKVSLAEPEALTPAPVAITADGKLVAAGTSGGAVKLWEVPAIKANKD